MPFSQILRIFQTISLVALFILPISNRRPLFISSESNSGSKHRSLGWMPSNKGILSKFYAQSIFRSYQFYA